MPATCLVQPITYTVVDDRLYLIVFYDQLIVGNLPVAVYVGCFTDNPARHLPDLRYDNDSMTQEMCIVHCRDQGYSFAGLEVI